MELGRSLTDVLVELDTTLLELIVGDPTSASNVESISIFDEVEPHLPSRAIVLGVGAKSGSEVVKLLDEVAGQDAVALVVRSPIQGMDEIVVRETVARTGVVLLGLTQGASWAQLAFLLGSLLGIRASLRADHDLGSSATDLFSVANAVSAILDAPITIEDRNSQVLAFSGRQDETDQARIDTIIGRRVPPEFTRGYQAQGIFRRLYREERPIVVEPVATEQMPRVAIAVRSGQEILGSIWAITKVPLSPEREQAFIDSAKLVALNMLRQSVAADVARHLRSQRVMSVLEGGPSAAEAARSLGIDHPAVVWAWGFTSADESPNFHYAEAERQRVVDALAFQAAAIHPASGVTAFGDTAYVLLPVSVRNSHAEADSVRAARAFLKRTANQFSGRIGVSRVAENPEALPRMRREAERALRVLRTLHSTGTAGGISDLGIDALILELRDLAIASGHRPTGPVARLLDYDRERGGDLLATLRVWLDCFGDVGAAADMMQVHHNTFRYRLRRAIEVGQIDVDDFRGRFAMMVQLRLVDPTNR